MYFCFDIVASNLGTRADLLSYYLYMSALKTSECIYSWTSRLISMRCEVHCHFIIAKLVSP